MLILRPIKKKKGKHTQSTLQMHVFIIFFLLFLIGWVWSGENEGLRKLKQQRGAGWSPVVDSTPAVKNHNDASVPKKKKPKTEKKRELNVEKQVKRK